MSRRERLCKGKSAEEPSGLRMGIEDGGPGDSNVVRMHGVCRTCSRAGGRRAGYLILYIHHRPFGTRATREIAARVASTVGPRPTALAETSSTA